jgi:hypothetical protein
MAWAAAHGQRARNAKPEGPTDGRHFKPTPMLRGTMYASQTQWVNPLGSTRAGSGAVPSRGPRGQLANGTTPGSANLVIELFAQLTNEQE